MPDDHDTLIAVEAKVAHVADSLQKHIDDDRREFSEIKDACRGIKKDIGELKMSSWKGPAALAVIAAIGAALGSSFFGYLFSLFSQR